MKSTVAFLKKEWTEHLRSGRLVILMGLFLLFGVMNPAIAKLTPWLLEAMADSLAQSGMTITVVSVTAMDSWVQFFKNIPMALIVFLIMESSIFTREYQSGTLILVVTKGFGRGKILLAKTIILLGLWSAGYWLCYSVTYGYNAYFWDNSVAQNLGFSVFCWWLLGIWTVSLAVLFSAAAQTNSAVLGGTAAVFLAAYLATLFPKLKPFSPALLMDSTALVYGLEEASAYTDAVWVAAGSCIIFLAASLPIFRKKAL